MSSSKRTPRHSRGKTSNSSFTSPDLEKPVEDLETNQDENHGQKPSTSSALEGKFRQISKPCSDLEPDSGSLRGGRQKSAKRKTDDDDEGSVDSSTPRTARKRAKTAKHAPDAETASDDGAKTGSETKGSKTKSNSPKKQDTSPPLKKKSDFAGALGLSPMKNGTGNSSESLPDLQTVFGTRDAGIVDTEGNARKTPPKLSPTGADLLKTAMKAGSSKGRKLFLKESASTVSPNIVKTPTKPRRGRPPKPKIQAEIQEAADIEIDQSIETTLSELDDTFTDSVRETPQQTSTPRARGRPKTSAKKRGRKPGRAPAENAEVEASPEQAGAEAGPLELEEGCGVPVTMLGKWEAAFEESTPVVCPLCDKEFDSVTSAQDHYVRSHGGTSTSRVTSSEALDEVLVRESYENIDQESLYILKTTMTKSRRVKCWFCGVKIRDLDLAVVHHLQCDVIQDPPSCTRCESTFRTRLGIWAHYMHKHTVWYDLVAGCTTESLSVLLKYRGSLRCQQCTGEFHAVKAYRRHAETCDGTLVEEVSVLDSTANDDVTLNDCDVTPHSGRTRGRRVRYDEHSRDSDGSDGEYAAPRVRSSPEAGANKRKQAKDEWFKKLDALCIVPDVDMTVPREYITRYHHGNAKKHLPCPKKCGRQLGSATALKYHYPRCGVDARRFQMVCSKCGAHYYYAQAMRQHVVKCFQLEDPYAPKDNSASLLVLPDGKRRTKRVPQISVTYDDSDIEIVDDDGDRDFEPGGGASGSEDTLETLFKDGRRMSVASAGRISSGRDWTYQRCRVYREKLKQLVATVNMRPRIQHYTKADPSAVPSIPGCPPFRLESLPLGGGGGGDTESDTSWQVKDVPSLELFRSATTSSRDEVSTCYVNVGLPAFSAVWRENSEPKSDQYFLLNTLPSFSDVFCDSNIYPQTVMMQLWNCGKMNQMKEISPKMVLGLVHEWGIVLDMRWNSFTMKCLKEDSTLKTLGYVLVATGDGVAKVFAVPEPLLGDGCYGEEYKENCYTVEACARFELGDTDPLTNPCLSCDWSMQGDDAIVAIGYRNGVAALFDLSTQSPLLRTEGCHGDVPMDRWRPHRTFWAHTKEVRRVRWSTLVPRIIVTTGSEQKLSMWHTDDVHEGPIHSMVKGYVKDLEWSRLDHALFFSVESTQRLNGAYTCMLDEEPHKSVFSLGNRRLLASTCSANSVDHSDWLCNTAGGTAEGDVTANTMTAFKPTRMKQRQSFWISKTVVRSQHPELKQEEPDEPEPAKTPEPEPSKSPRSSKSPKSPRSRKRRIESDDSDSDSIDADPAENTMDDSMSSFAGGPSSGGDGNQSSAPGGGGGNQEKLPYLARSVQSHEELGKNFDLVFQDNHLGASHFDSDALKFTESSLSPESLDAYPAKAVYKVTWNPNPGTCHWLLVARHCGLVSLHNMAAFLPMMARK